jgi:hypothetical protein
LHARHGKAYLQHRRSKELSEGCEVVGPEAAQQIRRAVLQQAQQRRLVAATHACPCDCRTAAF